MPAQTIIEIQPQPGSQLEMVTSPALELFYGGQAGGGKSYGFLLDFLGDIGHPKANAIFFRRHYQDLEQIIEDAKMLYNGFGWRYNESKHLGVFPSGARIRFAHMNTVKDIFKYTGKNWTHQYWDELPQFPKKPYLLMIVWLRSPAKGIFKRIRSSGNPDGEGFLWCKHRFIDCLEPFKISHFVTVNNNDIKVPKGTPHAITRQFIPCYREENNVLMEADPEYSYRMELLPEHLKRAYKYGIWEVTDRPLQVVNSDWWFTARSGDVKFKLSHAAVGGDYAESGDQCCVCSGRGNRPERMTDYPGMKTTEFSKILYKEHMLYGLKSCYTGVDSVGPGVGCFHDLSETNIASFIYPCKYKEEGFDAKFEKLATKLKFDCWRSQAWWQFRMDMENEVLDLSLLSNYENIEMLEEEIFAHTFEIKNGVLRVIAKLELRKEDSLGRSPDRADTLVIWNWVRRFPEFKKRSESSEEDYGIDSSTKHHKRAGQAVAYT